MMAFIGHVRQLHILRIREQLRLFKLQRRGLRDASNPFEIHDFHFEKLFRLNKVIVMEIIGQLTPALQRVRRDGLPVHLQVLVTLRFLGYGSYQRVVGQGFLLAVSQPSVSRCVRQVTKAIYEVYLNNVIRFPSNIQERAAVERRFTQVTRFPGVLGCIDCTHIAITTPFVQEDAFKNHHGFYSLNVQMICDEELRILNINANFPGTVHDQFIFNASLVKNEMQRLHENRIGSFFLLGDSGYALTEYMLTPVLNADPGSAEERFTLRHCLVRNRIERVFGVIKARWRCLRRDRILHYQPRASAYIIYACAVLHNLSLNRQPLPEIEEAEPAILAAAEVREAGDRANGLRVRNQIIQTYFNN